jgi:uncharacterized membrane protein YjjP (DUF1212 family)
VFLLFKEAAMKSRTRTPRIAPGPPDHERPVLDAHRIVFLATEAGKLLLENGAEIHRVEEIINRIISAYGLEGTESFVTPTGIMVSTVDFHGDTITRIRTVHARTVNLGKIAGVTQLVRSIADRAHKPLSPDLLEGGLMAIRAERPYHHLLLVAAAAAVGGFFALIFGGSWREFLSGVAAGACARGLTAFLSARRINDFFINMCGSALVTLLCKALSIAGFTAHPNFAIIGALMLFVPGLAITNSIRDTLAGDLLSGLARGIEAVFIAVAVAAGSGVALEISAFIRGAAGS